MELNREMIVDTVIIIINSYDQMNTLYMMGTVLIRLNEFPYIIALITQ